MSEAPKFYIFMLFLPPPVVLGQIDPHLIFKRLETMTLKLFEYFPFWHAKLIKGDASQFCVLERLCWGHSDSLLVSMQLTKNHHL